MTEDEMVGWHHQLDGHESEQTPGISEGQIGKPGVLQSVGLQTQTRLKRLNNNSDWSFFFFFLTEITPSLQ